MMQSSFSQPIAIVPTPFTAAGAVSGGDLELYVKWFRGTPVDGVLIWTALSGAGLFNSTEREEIYSLWRSGILPHQKLLVQLPTGGQAVTTEALQFQANHARELGVDGIVCELPSDELPPLDADLPIYDLSNKSLSFSYATAVRRPTQLDPLLRALPDDARAAVLLAVLAHDQVIAPRAAHSPGGKLLAQLTDPGAFEAYHRLITTK